MAGQTAFSGLARWSGCPEPGQARRVGIVAASRFPAPRGSQVHIGEMAPLDPQATDTLYRRHPLSSMAKFRPRPSVSGLHLLERPFFDTLLAGRLLQVVSRERLEILHAHNYEALAASLLVRRMSGVKVVYHAHNVAEDELPLYSPSWISGLVRVGARQMDANLPRMADAVVALSTDVRDHLVSHGVAADRIWVIPPGLDPAPFQSRRQSPRLRSAVFAGNCDEYQNLQHLFQSWQIVAANDPQAELRIVTHARGGVLKKLRSAGRDMRIRIVEAHELSQVADELGQACVGVSPRGSWSGFPIKNLNYMAAGLPTIALRGSAKGIVDGETGWVVDSERPEAFAAAITAALGDQAESARRGAAAHARVLRDHCWHTLIDPLLECSSVVAGSRGLRLVPNRDGVVGAAGNDFSRPAVPSERFPL